MKSVIPYFKVVSSMVLGCLGQRGFKQPAVKHRPNTNTRNQKAFCPLPSAFWLLVLITPSAVRAQIVPDNTLPVNSQVTGCPVCTIEGGTIRGVNLFHSFQEFGVQTGGEAFFNNGLDIENILGRVTGTNISDIDGWIRANGTANLFLINPNGIVFGENARLDVGGSFVASTANALGFGNQGVFSATEPEAPPLLTVNPDVLFFNQLAAQGVSSIEVRGSLSVLSGESLLLVGGNVAPDATKTGELLIDGGTLTAPGGRVELAGVGAPGEVGLVVNQGSLGLNFPADLARTDISIFGSTIDVREAGGGDIVIYAKDLTIGSSIIGNKPALGETYTLQVSIESPAVGSPNPNQEVEPNNSINRAQSLDDSFSVAANPDVESSTTVPFVSISGTGDGTFDYYSFTVETAGSQGIFDIDQGNTGGAGSLDTELFLFDAQGGLLASNDDAAITQGAGGSSSIRDSYIRFNFETPGTYVIGVGKYNSNSRFSRLRAGIASGFGSVDAQAGNITIDATGTVAVAEGVISNTVQAGAIGRGGDVQITASSVSLTNGAQIDASTFGEGDAGKVVIRATDNVLLDGEDTQGFVSRVDSRVESGATGDSGGVEIESSSLSLTNGALISANTRGEGNAGQVVIRATDSVFLDGENTQGFTSRILSAVEPEAEGNSGGVEIESGSLTATNGAGINASTLGEGDAGQVVIRATDSVFLDGESRRGFNSGVFSLVESGARGNSGGVEIESGSLSLTNGAVISANTQGEGNLTATNGATINASTLGEGNAGLVVIRATDSIFLDGEDSEGFNSGVISQVTSEAKGNSGGIEIDSSSLSLTNGALITANTRGEGNAGLVVIRATDSIFLDGENTQGFTSRILSAVEPEAEGNSGGVEIESGSLTATNGAGINASTLGEGDAGQVVIRATDSVFLDGESRRGFNSGVFSLVESGARGNSGGVEIESGSLSLTNGAVISANTQGEGKAGLVVIRATDNVFLDGENTQGLSSRILSAVQSGAKGNSGGVEIESGSLSLTNGAQISANTEGEGDAGLVVIRATDSIFFDGEDSQGFNSGVFSLVQSGAQGNSGGVEIESGSLSLTNGAVINANTLGEGDAGQVVIRATDSIFLDGENSQGFNSGVFSQVNSEAQGNSGGIEIESGSLSLTNGATISANTQGEGNAGLVVIRATDSVFLDGEDTQGGSSRILSGVQSGAKGNSGGVEIESGSLTATNGATINASTLGEGNAGQVVIRATDSIFLDGEDSEGFNSGVFSVVNSGAKGNSGGVEIESGSLTATNGATINASTLGEGNAGLVVIRATDSIFLDGEDSEGFNSGVFSQVESGAQGNSGGIEIESSSLSLTNGALISAETNSSGMAGDVRLNVTDFIQLSGDSAIRANATAGGPAGDLTIETGRITLDNGAEITVSSPSGQAGDLTITADSLRLNQGRILAETATSDAAGGANINLNGLNLLLLENESLISANALEDANGGNVTIDARFIVATPPTGPNGSDITANAVRGNGGAVNVTTQGLFGIEFRPQLTPQNDITVSSEFGLSGRFELNSPNVDPSRGLLNLPSQFVDASRQMRQNCPARGSGQENRFVVTGTGGLPPRPGDSIDSPFPTGEVRSLPSSSVSHNAPGKAKVTENVESANRTQIIEATGWVRNEKGEVILVASNPTTPQNRSTSATCTDAVGTR